jgi:hypothetical protein
MQQEARRKAPVSLKISRRDVYRVAVVLGTILLLGDTIYVITQLTT